jgi:hypothetical protein
VKTPPRAKETENSITKDRIAQTLSSDPTATLREIADHLSISRTTVHRVLTGSLGYKSRGIDKVRVQNSGRGVIPLSELEQWVAEAIEAQRTNEKRYVSSAKQYIVDYNERLRPQAVGNLVANALAVMQNAKLVSVKKNSYALTTAARQKLVSGKIKKRKQVVRAPIWVKA